MWFNGRSSAHRRFKLAAPGIEEPESRVLLSANAAGFVTPDFQAAQQPPFKLLLDHKLVSAPTRNILQEANRGTIESAVITGQPALRNNDI